jgi:hypothetical protein
MSKIHVYRQEVEDGIDALVKSQASVAYHAPAHVVVQSESLDRITNPTIEKLIADSNQGQIDLYYLDSVLVSTGWNKNDDVFEPSVTWDARSTPEDKQFNFMHDENDIIGHITGSYIIDKSGNRLSADAEEAPPQFDIITEAVLYNSWTNLENRNRMQQIIAEIEEGKWFVSMECLFNGFDYALVDSEGNSKLLERNESSAFLTKHLRAYGGTGEYEGHKVGRALRDISFSGKGLVSKPANPRSIIFKCSKAFNVNEDDKLTKFSTGEEKMADNSPLLEKQVSDLQAALVAAKEENEAMKKNIESAKDKEYADTIESFVADDLAGKETIASLEETIKSQKANIAEIEDALAQRAEELSEAMKTMEEWKQRDRQQKRLASLVSAGFDEEEAQESLSLYEALDDEAFEAIVAQWFDKKEKDKKKKKKDDDKEKDADATADTDTDEVEVADEAEAEVETSEEVFDEVESTEAALVEASDEEDELQSTRASVADWISENVLQTN